MEILKEDRFYGIKLLNGVLRVNISQDPEYPGLDIEFISETENENQLSRPRVLIEKPVNGELRALIWNNPNEEDYQEEITFTNN